MGVVSRRVLPICGRLCCFCPSMRARSRQPVGRYKKLLAGAMARSKDGQPNYRMINKLCEYVSKNPMRVPKITATLEQKCYKELRTEHFSQAGVVPCIYCKLLASCKEQMPLFAPSLLSIVQTLLEQTRHDEMRMLGCHMLIEFLKCQVDSTYMFNIERLIPKVCLVSREVGSETVKLKMRSAGMQTLAFMVHFMGDFSHISMDFDEIVSVTLNNYEVQQVYLPNDQQNSMLHNQLTLEKSESPSYWSMICLHNMAKLSKEATTMRRVLDSLFRSFDCENYWSPNKGVALSVLSGMQILMESSGQNSHLLLSRLIKHLDHKNAARWPNAQCNVLKVAANLARNAKMEASISIITAISDLIRHLRKCMQHVLEASNQEDEDTKRNSLLHSALEECLGQLTKRVGDIGPILDMMAVALENMPTTETAARATISSVHRIAQITASLPNISYNEKAFPDALFHQLLLTMTHPDHETRVGAHRVISAVLASSAMFSWLLPSLDSPKESDDTSKTLLITLSGFSSLTTMLEKVGEKNSLLQNQSPVRSLGTKLEGMGEVKCRDSALNGKIMLKSGEKELKTLRLSSHQVGLLLSSIWAEAASEDNTPSNYEAMAHSYTFALLFSRAKTSSHVALTHCFQLVLSLWRISRNPENPLPPSRKRSLLALASAMIISSVKAADIRHLIPSVQNFAQADPYLHLGKKGMLRAVHVEPSNGKKAYGSEEDDFAAAKFLAEAEADDGRKLEEAIILQMMGNFGNLSEEEQSTIKLQLSQEFLPSDEFQSGAAWHADTPFPPSPFTPLESLEIEELMAASFLEEEYLVPEAIGSQSDSKTSESVSGFGVLNVNQLMESALGATREVAISPASTRPIPYDQMMTQCQALVLGKQQKLSTLLSSRKQLEPQRRLTEGPTNPEITVSVAPPVVMHERDPDGPTLPLKLPPAIPYDKFLRAAGC